MIPTAQEEVARFLAGLAVRPPIETHTAAVFVGADTVWKMKKAVALPYLDFRELAARHRYLERELTLNQPAAPDLYRDVVPLTQSASGRIGFAEPGKPVEWVLRMAPVPPSDFLDTIAAEGRFTPELGILLGRAVARYHHDLVPLSGIDQVALLTELVAETLRSLRGAGFAAARITHWERGIRAGLAERRDWLTERAARGFVRRAHGDLHLRNICLWHGEPTPFDALEFDERLAIIDLGFDLAFLLMDCDLRIGRAMANAVLASYVAASDDVGLVGGLVPFLSLRAITRAHVEAVSANEVAARRYLDAADAYLTPRPPALVAIGGLPGAGKSTLAHALAPGLGAAPGALVLSSDLTRKRYHGVAPETRLPPEAYTREAGQRVADALVDGARRALGLGHAVILDATFLDPALRVRAEEVAAITGVPFLGLWLDAPLGTLEERIEGRARQARRDPSDATIAVLHRFAHSALPPGETWRRVTALSRDTARITAEGLLARTLAASFA